MLRRRSRKWQGKIEGQLRLTHSSRGDRNSVVLGPPIDHGGLPNKGARVGTTGPGVQCLCLVFRKVRVGMFQDGHTDIRNRGTITMVDTLLPSRAQNKTRPMRESGYSFQVPGVPKEEVGVQGIDPPPRRGRERDQPTRVSGQEGRECGRQCDSIECFERRIPEVVRQGVGAERRMGSDRMGLSTR